MFVIPGIKTFMLVCPLVFLAGFVDAIGGGGGLISLPAYLIAGLPAHNAIGTNKMSSCFGTALVTARFAKQGLINWHMAWPSVITAFIGAYCGSNLSLMVDNEILTKILYVVLPITAILVLRKDTFKNRGETEPLDEKKTTVIAAAAALILGVYDGFYGPGTGTFLIIAFSLLARMDVLSANGQCKAINLTTNVTSLLVFLFNGQTLIFLGLAAAACNMLGGWIGSGLAIKEGTRITRPIILIVLGLLLLRVAGVY